MAESEFDRQYRVLDQMISMHASLGQRFNRRALVLTCGLLFSSALLCSLTFAPDSILEYFGIEASKAKLLLGGFSALVFALSIIQLRVNWEHTGQKHSEAAKRLAPLKHRYRECQAKAGAEKETMERSVSEEYARVMQELPQIPDRWFLALKAGHCFKRELSKAIDKHPTAPVWFLKLRLRCRGVIQSAKAGTQNE